MRYALISDIHANLPALTAVLRHIDGARPVPATYHLGDLVGYATWPNEVVGLLHGREIAGVSGNYDSTVASDYKHCGCRYESGATLTLVHFVNAGSVGRPKDGDPRACYVTVDLAGPAPVVEFIRVEYDIERAALAITDAGLPREFADLLRSG